jgi:tetratricopeptide (TPR) repeat protein
MGRTSLRITLVEALDEWATLRRRTWGDNDPFRHKLVAINRHADPDQWRDSIREASLRGDRQALAKLADTVPLRDVPPPTLWLLGNELMELDYADRAMVVLQQAQRQYPDDYRINDTLGWFSRTAFSPPRYEDALRYYSIASALRPHLPRGHRALAEALAKAEERNFRPGKNRSAEAIAEYSRVIELTPEDARAWIERGKAGGLDRARQGGWVAAWRRPCRLHQGCRGGPEERLGPSFSRSRPLREDRGRGVRKRAWGRLEPGR